ncbi:methylase [Floricoccus penangensis]|uniref:Methylase n=1 Tax=Floricoccus penangensis TaxID=1859475 RepID=A0A9Q5JH23_9LACT|nr:methyltransferase domain-containing protein [Floricoccus penangensis]OFI47257.1 methylase [Floricoccus penangensis]
MTENVFNSMANNYDNYDRKKLADVIRLEISKYLSNDSSNDILLDYGGGTGLVSLPIVENFKKVIIADSSKQMLEIALDKINIGNISNASILLVNDTTLLPNADIVILSLVLIHIPDTETILNKIYKILNPNGKVIIVDFDKNEKVNHPMIHNGFQHEELKAILEKEKFKNITIKNFYSANNLFMKENATLFIVQAEK